MLHDDKEGEIERLERGPSTAARPPAVGTAQMIVLCEANADEVLQRAKDVMRAVLVHSRNRWPSDDEWKALLPEWFGKSCAKEKTEAEMEAWLEQWRQLPPDQQAEASRKNWSLSNWLAWFEPGERQWVWWDAFVENRDLIRVVVAVEDWPFAWGALEWLFLASGAKTMLEE